jgi:hypothetical protein
MTLVERIHHRMTEARKARKIVEKNVLSVLLGEIQNLQNSKGQRGPVTDRQIASIIRRIVDGNAELLRHDPKLMNKIMLEKITLENYLPMTWTKDQILDWLGNNPKHAKMLREQKTDGLATGIAIKILNANQCPVEGKDVSDAIVELRNTA